MIHIPCILNSIHIYVFISMTATLRPVAHDASRESILLYLVPGGPAKPPLEPIYPRCPIFLFCTMGLVVYRRLYWHPCPLSGETLRDGRRRRQGGLWSGSVTACSKEVIGRTTTREESKEVEPSQLLGGEGEEKSRMVSLSRWGRGPRVPHPRVCPDGETVQKRWTLDREVCGRNRTSRRRVQVELKGRGGGEWRVPSSRKVQQWKEGKTESTARLKKREAEKETSTTWHPLTVNRYFRLMALATVELLSCTTPISAYTIYLNFTQSSHGKALPMHTLDTTPKSIVNESPVV